ncbi:unnamed protein product [Adineta steineri]|uniref:Ankyrin repeat protein n=1 Tax=Adineta steineri TaxID=433720 RepID=A0A814C3V8_9BILA|nr:unnamed protein product [Adineta steineri]
MKNYFILGASTIIKKNNVQLVLDKIADSIALLFTTNSFTPLLRICRLFVQKQPHLFHTAIEKNYFYLLSQFIPITPLKLLQQKNQLGETILLHILRLNHLDVLKILLEHKKFDELLDDVNNKKQNIFHILALNKDAEEICDLSQFIPITPLKLLQQKNQLGETILLHILRLNHLDVLKILLEHKKFDELLDDVNNKKQNIFHILALNKDAEEICDLLIEDLVKKSINIEEKFGNVDEDNRTPLELSIKNDNLPITRYLLKHFNNDTSLIISNGI